MWHDLLVALSLMLVVEGIFPFLNPNGVRRTMLAVSQLSDTQLRLGGIVSMFIGLLALYLIK